MGSRITIPAGGPRGVDRAYADPYLVGSVLPRYPLPPQGSSLSVTRPRPSPGRTASSHHRFSWVDETPDRKLTEGEVLGT